jgi:lipoprotein signal peptidase
MTAAWRRWLLVGVAAPLAALDLAQKASEPVYGHPRSFAYVAGALALAALLVAFVPRVPSVGVALAAGVAVAGDAGNLVAAIVWRGGVPNPIVAGSIAFNLADAYAVVGAFALVLGAALFALRNRELLRQRV